MSDIWIKFTDFRFILNTILPEVVLCENINDNQAI